jgi:oxygen-independent coproporphyrinogen-3 oxidase
MDAHSMLFTRSGNATRFATPDSLEAYVQGADVQPTAISQQVALEETFFLGLRLNRGLDLVKVGREFEQESITALSATIAELIASGLLERQGNSIRLTPRGPPACQRSVRKIYYCCCIVSGKAG